MTRRLHRLRFLLPMAGVLLFLLLLPPRDAEAQRSDVRVLRAWSEPVKIDGVETTYRVEILFDYRVGEAQQRVYDANGRLVEETVLTSQPHPTSEELEMAYALIRADAALMALAQPTGSVYDGGFLLHEDAGQPCGPGTRCLQIEILTPDRETSIRMVAVDLVSGQIKHRNLHPGH